MIDEHNRANATDEFMRGFFQNIFVDKVGRPRQVWPEKTSFGCKVEVSSILNLAAGHNTTDKVLT